MKRGTVLVIVVVATGVLAGLVLRTVSPGSASPARDLLAALELEAARPPQPRLVLEEGFESDRCQATPPETCFALKAWHGGASGAASTASARTGARGFRITSDDPAGADADVFRILRVRGDHRYRLEGWIRTEGLEPIDATTHGTLHLIEYRNEAEIAGSFTNRPRIHRDLERHEGTTDGWRRVAYTFTTMSQTRFLRIAASLGNWGRARGTVHVDDLRLEELPPAGIWIAADDPLDDRARVGSFELDGDTRRAVALPVGQTVEHHLRVPKRASLDFALGLVGSAAESAPVRFRLTAESSGVEITLLEEVLAAGAGFVDRLLPLPALAGRDVTLRASALPLSGQAGGRIAVLWAHPTLRWPARRRATSVVWVSVDTLRADHVGHLGYERDTTPTLDRLAAEGATFRAASSASPWTLPSHASMLTSSFPSTHGADDRTGLGPELPTAAEMFARAGWFCGAFTSHLYLSPTFGFERGFHTFHVDQDARAEVVIERALDWLRAHGEQPTFLFIHLFDPHWGYGAPEPYTTMFDPDYRGPASGSYLESVLPFKDPKVVPEARDLDHVVARYDGEIRYTDQAIGRLLDGIAQLGLAHDTLTVVTSDHGEEFREHGSMGHGTALYEEQLHVPLILHGASVRATPPIDAPVRTVDILPTLADLAGVELDGLPTVGGVSLVPLLRDPTFEVPPAFAETRRFSRPKRSMRRGSDKVILADDRPARLFDLATDPDEHSDRAGSEPDRTRALVTEAEAFFDALAATAPSGGDPSVALTAAEREVLRSLGYLE